MNFTAPISQHPDQWFLDTLDAEQRRSLGSVNIYKCPSRRGGTQIAEWDGGGSTDSAGPRSDYAVVVTKESHNFWGQYCILSTQLVDGIVNSPAAYKGPLRIAYVEFWGNWNGDQDQPRDAFWNARNWSPRDEMVWWQDGTSNQIVFGEKFIPAWALGGSRNEAKRWDGGYLQAFPNEHTFNVGRLVHGNFEIFARSPTDSRIPDDRAPHDVSWESYQFGSHHSGICQFLFGDGAVRAMSINTSTTMMFNLARVDDGNPVDF
jgi:hypothetical protein